MKISAKPARTSVQLKVEVQSALAWLKRNSSARFRNDMARYGLPSKNAMGVPMRSIQKLAKLLGRDHDLAIALWDTGVYEARILVAYVGEPERLTPAQMDRWCRDFDNWGVVDTLCFALFNDSPHAWSRVAPWARAKEEFVRRASFALLACLSGPKRNTADKVFLKYLPLIERGATDERNFVKKGVSWALRMIGRRNPTHHTATLAVAHRLADSVQPGARWVGKDALKDLTRPLVVRRLASARSGKK